MYTEHWPPQNKGAMYLQKDITFYLLMWFISSCKVISRHSVFFFLLKTELQINSEEYTRLTCSKWPKFHTERNSKMSYKMKTALCCYITTTEIHVIKCQRVQLRTKNTCLYLAWSLVYNRYLENVCWVNVWINTNLAYNNFNNSICY